MNRLELCTALDELCDAHADVAVAAIVEVLLDTADSAAGDLLAVALMTREDVVRLILDGRFQNLSEAIRVTRRVAEHAPSLTVYLMMTVWSEGQLQETSAAAHRALAIVEEVGPLMGVLPILKEMAGQCTDPFLRSRATVLALKADADATLMEEQLADPDPRVRANALEAIWGARNEVAVRIFRRFADAVEENNRVIVNALIGLYLAGEEDHAVQRLTELKEHSDLPLQASAQWAIAHVNNLDADPAGQGLSGKAVKFLNRISDRAWGTVQDTSWLSM